LNSNLNGLLNSYAAQRQAEATALVTSKEYRTDLVNGWYQRYLGRAADAAGLAGNVAALAAGTTDEQVIAGLVGSGEFFTLHGGNNSGFVTAAFNEILARNPTPNELLAYVNELQTVSRTTVATQLMHTNEYRTDLIGGVAANPALSFVGYYGFYQAFLGRTDSGAGIAGWVAALASGMTDEQVINAFLTTGEYFQRPRNYPSGAPVSPVLPILPLH
jgi:hypothetical protein